MHRFSWRKKSKMIDQNWPALLYSVPVPKKKRKVYILNLQFMPFCDTLDAGMVHHSTYYCVVCNCKAFCTSFSNALQCKDRNGSVSAGACFNPDERNHLLSLSPPTSSNFLQLEKLKKWLKHAKGTRVRSDIVSSDSLVLLQDSGGS